jgi:hypothetical protein
MIAAILSDKFYAEYHIKEALSIPFLQFCRKSFILLSKRFFLGGLGGFIWKKRFSLIKKIYIGRVYGNRPKPVRTRPNTGIYCLMDYQEKLIRISQYGNPDKSCGK